MYQNLILCNQIRLGNGAVRYPGADHQDHVRLVHGAVSVFLPVVAHHAVEHRILGRKNAESHHGADSRNSEHFGKLLHLALRVRKMHTAADAQNRALRMGKLRKDLADLYRMAFHGRLVGPHGDGLRILKPADRLLLYVKGQIDQDRSRASCSCNVKGFLKDPRDLLGAAHDVAVLDEGLHRAGNVRLLKDVAAHLVGIHLSGDADHGNAVRKGRCNSGDQILRPGAAGYCYNAGLAGDSGIAAGGMRRTLLLPDQNGADIRL